MKVKIGELKTHLSRYVQQLRSGGERVEVCVREETVAYLTAADATLPLDDAEKESLEAQLEANGLGLSQWATRSAEYGGPGRAKDGASPENSVVAIRKEKDW